MKNTKALVVISFGSTFDETRTKDIGGIEKALAEAFPTYDQYRAFTSNIIRKNLAKRNIIIDDLETLLQKLVSLNYEEVLVQPTHLLHGEEFEQKILSLYNKFKNRFKRFTIGQPLILNDEDYYLTATVLISQLPKLNPNDGVILMGHGTPRDNNKSHAYTYAKLQNIFDKMHQPILVGTVEDEDYPNFNDIIKEIKKRGYTHVHMYPLMVVAGDHANNDMYGDEPDSWKSQIESLGITTTGHLHGIGRHKAIQALYIQHALKSLSYI